MPKRKVYHDEITKLNFIRLTIHLPYFLIRCSEILSTSGVKPELSHYFQIKKSNSYSKLMKLFQHKSWIMHLRRKLMYISSLKAEFNITKTSLIIFHHKIRHSPHYCSEVYKTFVDAKIQCLGENRTCH